jgi:type IV fimbrial biogenesis protein FimT
MTRNVVVQRGFTLIELIVVIVISAVLLVLAAPSFRDNFDRRRLEGQANELVTDLQYARSEAAARNLNVLLIPGGSGACYTVAAWAASAPGLARQGGCDCSLGPSAACPSGAGNRPRELKTVALAGGATVNGPTFEFDPVRGALEPATAASAAVQIGSRSYTVNVNAIGRVSPPTP